MLNQKDYSEIEYNGKITSFTVPSKIVFTRRNGKVSYQHNQHYTALVLVQKGKDGIYRVIYVDAWRREEFEDVQEKIYRICKDFGVWQVFSDLEDIGENQRLESKGLIVNPIAFSKFKIQMQSHLKVLFHQEKIKIPELFHDLVTELRKYNWNTKINDDRCDALQLACWGAKEDVENTFEWEII